MKENILLRIKYQLGVFHGRKNIPMAQPNNSAYVRGWLDGECAREEHENGCGWREDEGFH